MNSLIWLYMLRAYMLLVVIYVVCTYVVGGYICCVHICCWWLYMFMCIYVVGEFLLHAIDGELLV